MAEVGLAFLSAGIQLIFDRLAPQSLIWDWFQQRKNDGRLLKKLRSTLLAIGAVLDDAENKQIRDPKVKEWLDELRHVVYKADDLVDEINTEAGRRKVEAEYPSTRSPVCLGEIMSKLKVCFSSGNIFQLDDVMPKVEEITNTLDDFLKQIEVLGLQRSVDVKTKPIREESTSLVAEGAVYGRENEKENIVKQLLSDGADGNNFSVISLVGLGGVGKTTLAQLVYNDDRLENHFKYRAWVCVSDQYDSSRITSTLLQGPIANSINFDMLQKMLAEKLTGKKFLFILDDVWDDDYDKWCQLTLPFLQGEKGSKVIVTTRNKGVALMMGGELVQLELLLEEHCWTLFKKHAFTNGDANSRPEHERIGREIVKKCKGLPLAIKAIAGLLRKKPLHEQWDDVLRSDLWDLMNDPNGILPALRLSYNDLPSHLKQCFAFCAVFPKDYGISKQRLIWLWAANDLLHHSKNDERIEVTGGKYVDDLVTRSLFQVHPEDKSQIVMHDLVHDMAQYVSGNFCMILDNSRIDKIPEKICHLSYDKSKCHILQVLDSSNHLRTVLEIVPLPRLVDDRWQRKLNMLKCLRVLDLSNYFIGELPDSIGNLKHLRLLNLSRTGFGKLPHSICSLYNLQTLILSACVLSELPQEIGKLINLQHLDIKENDFLREIPRGINRLKGLQFLSSFIVGKRGSASIKVLGELCNLGGELFISGLENVASADDGLKAGLKHKNHLEVLGLKWNGETGNSQLHQDVLENLQPHWSIKQVDICGYGGTRFPSWIAKESLKNIVEMKLSSCENCFSLPALGQLTSLRKLSIQGMKGITEVGEEFYGDVSESFPFPSLLELKFSDMPEWKKWHVLGKGELANLEKLFIVDCPKLVGDLPNQLLTTAIKEINIERCPLLPRCQIKIDGCWKLFPTANEIPSHFSSIEKLKFSAVKEIQQDLSRLTNLKSLVIEDCSDVVLLHENAIPSALKSLRITRCRALPSIKEYLASALEKITIEGCDSLTDLSLGLYPTLTKLSIGRCLNLKTLVDFPSLEHMRIYRCPEVVFLQSGAELPSTLQSLVIWDCKNLTSHMKNWNLQRLSCLERFEVSHTEEARFPEEGLLPSSLKELTIRDSEMKRLNYKGLQHLTCLEQLWISGSAYLESLPEEGLPSSLSSLLIWDCPTLARRLERERGEDWSKIARIASLSIL